MPICDFLTQLHVSLKEGEVKDNERKTNIHSATFVQVCCADTTIVMDVLSNVLRNM